MGIECRLIVFCWRVRLLRCLRCWMGSGTWNRRRLPFSWVRTLTRYSATTQLISCKWSLILLRKTFLNLKEELCLILMGLRKFSHFLSTNSWPEAQSLRILGQYQQWFYSQVLTLNWLRTLEIIRWRRRRWKRKLIWCWHSTLFSWFSYLALLASWLIFSIAKTLWEWNTLASLKIK